MSLIHDLEQLVTSVLPIDPSFRSIGSEELARHINEAHQKALDNSKDEFLLSLMRLLALPGNGHTRLIPNSVIKVLPVRFATVGTNVRLLDATSGFPEVIGGELVSINGVPIGEIEISAEKFLAGSRQRKRVIGPILFAWPSALRHLGVSFGDAAIEYRIRGETGQISELLLDPANGVLGSTLYPRGEHGKVDASWTPKSFLEIKDFGQLGLLLVLPSFFDPSKTALLDAVSEAAELVSLHPAAPLIIDVRGNTGGDFLKTMPLIDAISEGTEGRRVGLLIDKFTFSAAIVFSAILKHRLGERLVLIGEEMGDGLTFYAEGGTVDLSSTGATVRYSTGFHDWAGGHTDETTPAEIAQRIVPAGKLELDRAWFAHSDDVETLDWFYREVLDGLNN